MLNRLLFTLMLGFALFGCASTDDWDYYPAPSHLDGCNVPNSVCSRGGDGKM